MGGTSVQYDGLEEVDGILREMAERFDTGRRELLEQAGEIIRQDVTSRIAASVNDNRGNVQRWQTVYTGSGGGYAAVRPIGEKDGGSTGADSEGAVTNYLEGGHRVRVASGTAKRRRAGRANKAYVDGKHFYDAARAGVEAKLIAASERFMDGLSGEADA